MEYEVKIRALMVDPNSGAPIIVLKQVEGEEMLPIWVGPFEASAIALEIEKVAPQRPMTHDLLRNLIVQLGAEVVRIVITELRDNTYFAVIEIKLQDGSEANLDARPSDAIALALRSDSPIFVAGEVFVLSGKASSAESSSSDEAAPGSEEDWPELIGDSGELSM